MSAPNVYASSYQSQIRAKLISIFKAEMNVGPNGAGTGSNVSGRLQSVFSGPYRSVAVQAPYPAIGVQFKRIDYSFSGSSRLNFTAEYLLLVAVEATVDSTGQVLLDQANDQLDAIVDDGAGNGIGPILLDPANYLLGGLALTTILSSWEYVWQDPSMTDSAPLAYAAATYKVSRQVTRRLATDAALSGDDAVAVPTSTASVAAGAAAAAIKTGTGFVFGVTVEAPGTAALTITDGPGGNVLVVVPANQIVGAVAIGGPWPYTTSLYVNSAANTPAVTIAYA